MKKNFVSGILSIIFLMWLCGVFEQTYSAKPPDEFLVTDTNKISAYSDTNVTFKDNFLKNIQVYFMGLIGMVSVGVFLYIGFILFTARGNEEEFKKAWKALIYAVVGLAVMPLAYIMVKIVTGFTF